MIYLSGARSTIRHPRLGFIITPRQHDPVPDGVVVAADNGCFNNPQGYSDDTYMRHLKNFPLDRTLFATAPDVLGNHAATVALSVPVLEMIRAIGLPAAFVAQDGWDEATTPWDKFDVLFVGGTTAFKFRGGRLAVMAAIHRGKKTHMGRVNSLDRLRAALSIGCASADGTFIKFGPDRRGPEVLSWLDAISTQTEMML